MPDALLRDDATTFPAPDITCRVQCRVLWQGYVFIQYQHACTRYFGASGNKIS